MPDIMNTDGMTPEDAALAWLIRGIAMGAASLGVVIAEAEIRAAFERALVRVGDGTDLVDWVTELVARKAAEQGVSW